MSTFWILLEQMELFVIYILAGVILVKAGCLTGDLTAYIKICLKNGTSIAYLYEYY